MNVLTTVPYETLSPAQDAQWTDTVCHEIVKRYIIYHSFNMSSSSFSKKIDPFSLWSIACELHWKGVLLPDFLETRIQETCLKSSLLSIRHLRVCSGFYILHKFKWFQSSSSFCHRSGSLLVSRQCGRGHRISPHRPWVVLPVTTRSVVPLNPYNNTSLNFQVSLYLCSHRVYTPIQGHIITGKSVIKHLQEQR